MNKTSVKHKKISLKDIADKASVSTSLVSFVLNGKSKQYRVSEEMTRKVLDIARELNYRPNLAAKTLRSGVSKTIGVVLSDISNPFFAHMARHIEDLADRAGYTVLFASSDENAKKMERQIDGLINQGADGLIIVPCEKSEYILEHISRENIPTVQLDRYVKDIDISYVCLNNFAATSGATSHLIDMGYRKIGIMAYDVKLMHMHERIRGYEDEMRRNGLEQNIMIGYVRHRRLKESVDFVLKEMLDAEVDALVLASNSISIEALHKIRDLGIVVPDRLGLVGFDGSEAFDFFYAPLSYLKQPVDLLAAKAVGVLRDQMENGADIRQFIEIKGELMIRASSVP